MLQGDVASSLFFGPFFNLRVLGAMDSKCGDKPYETKRCGSVHRKGYFQKSEIYVFSLDVLVNELALKRSQSMR